MAVKINLSIELEEFSTVESQGMDYKCRLTANANGVVQEFVFTNPLEALENGRQIVFSWVQIFVQLKRSTKKKLKALNQSRIIRP